MNTQIIKVYYDQNALPYKDKERTVHFPITGSTFIGSSDTTKIRFYVDGYLADENALWISVSKRADGTQGSQFLTTGTDGDGDKYREMTLSGWYTSKKGDLYISLKGYQGGSTGYWDNETGMYVVQGVPVIRATGSIKLAINYAPVGEYPYYQDEMLAFQDLVAQLGNKLNITSGIKVVNSTSSIIVSNEEEGQLFYSKADKKLYQLVSGSVVVFFETYDKDTLDTKFSGKVDKLTTSGKYVYAHITAQQGEIQVGEDVINNAIPNRTSAGQLKVPTTPTDNSHATSKSYVDSGLELKADKATTYTKTETDNAIASAVSSVYKYKGSVATYEDLPTTDLEVGDVYNVEDTGDNYAWDGTAWDKLSGTVDLSGYYTKPETNSLLDTKADKATTYTKTQTDTLLDTKADKSTTYTKDQTDNLLQNYAHANGTYPNMTVGKSLTTEQIENISEDTGSTQTNPFLFQGTGTNDNTTETPTAPIAKHLELRGNSVKWNQLGDARKITRTSETFFGFDLSVSGNEITIDGTWDGTGTAEDKMNTYLGSYYSFIPNHKYLIKVNQKSGSISGTASYVSFGISYKDIPTTARIQDIVYGTLEGATQLYTFPSDIGSQINILRLYIGGLDISDPVVFNNFTFVFQIFDLTNIYGAGKEPNSYLQFVRDYPLPYYEYNEGELKSCSSSKLITIGGNAFDGLITKNYWYNTSGQKASTNNYDCFTNLIKVIQGQKYIITKEAQSTYLSNAIYVRYFDGSGNCLTTTENGVSITLGSAFEIPQNANYVAFYSSFQQHFGSNPLFMFRLYWDESHDFVEYIKHEYDLPNEELRSVGSVYDTITPNGIHTQRIGSYTFVGNESGTIINTDSETGFVTVRFSVLNGLGKTNGEILSAIAIKAPYSSFVYTNSGYCFMPGQYAVDFNLGESSVEATLLKLVGTTIYFELETPIVSEVSSFAENIEVDDFGTMEFVPSDSTQDIIVPQGNKFFYPADYVLFIDDLYNRSKDGGETSSANNFVTQSELEDAIGNIPTPDIDTLINPTIKSSESSTYGLVSPDTTSLTANSEIVDTASSQTISGVKTFSNGIELGVEGINYQSFIKFKRQGVTIATIDGQSFSPNGANKTLGDNYNKWKDLYLSGGLSDGTNSVTVADISNGLFNVINASDIVNNTLTQAQYDLITNGKPTVINGTFRNLTNPILYSGYATSSYYFGQIQGYYNGEYQYLIYYINLSTKLVETDSSKIAFNLANNQVILHRLNIVNGKVIPAYPSSTGTFILKCVDGTLTWVAE